MVWELPVLQNDWMGGKEVRDKYSLHCCHVIFYA